VRADSERQLAKPAQSGAIDLIGAISQQVAEHYGLRTSVPYATDNIYVILTRQEEQGIDTIRRLAGKTVAMTHHVPLAQRLEGSRITQVESAEKRWRLAQGRVDAAIVPLFCPPCAGQ
jgi:two-component system sensor histidine kinase EvgS